MRNKARAWISVAFLAPMVGACATATTGTSQTILLGSTPEGANCEITRQGEILGRVTTPGRITVKRSEAPINVVCTKDGHEDARTVLNSQTRAGVIGGPTAIGLLISVGSMVDAASGANIHYPMSAMLDLRPLLPADQATASVGKSSPSPETAVLASASAASPAAPAAAPAPFLTGPWQAKNVLIADRSLVACAPSGGSYSLDLAGDTLTVDNVNGRMLVTTIPPDGTIDQRFRSPSGARLQIVGNARTRDLEIVNSNAGCRWKLTPV